MKPEQIRRRYIRKKVRAFRKKRKNSAETEQTRPKDTSKKGRPCCGKLGHNCTCHAPKKIRKSHVTELAKWFAKTDLWSIQDTTDVSVFQTLMQPYCANLPLKVITLYAHTHVVFNQEHLLARFIEQKAFTFKPPWINWQLLQSIVTKSKAAGELVRSSNYRSTTLKKVLVEPHMGKPRTKPKNPVARDVLACRIIGEDAVPNACFDLYDSHPSRDLWKAMLLTWLEQAKSKSKGCFDHYYMKCTLDRIFAVRKIPHSTISWWPHDCPAYLTWYEILCPGQQLSEKERFQILCHTYLTLNRYKTCTFTNALAQTCWLKKHKNGKLDLPCL